MNTDTNSILVVDDNAPTRETIALCLRTLGYDVCTAGGGKSAMALLRERDFDVVITDLLMPDADGTEVIMAVRRFQPGTRVIAMSGGGDFFAAAELLNVSRVLGADAQIEKPFSREQLLRAVTRLCVTPEPLAGAA